MELIWFLLRLKNNKNKYTDEKVCGEKERERERKIMFYAIRTESMPINLYHMKLMKTFDWT